MDAVSGFHFREPEIIGAGGGIAHGMARGEGASVQGRKSIRGEGPRRRCEQPLITETAFIGYRA